MSRRWSGTDAVAPVDPTRSIGWHPIRLVQYDVDAPPDSGPLDGGEFDRVWLEVVKHGRVIGLLEPDTDCGALSAADLAEIDGLRSSIDAMPDERRADERLARASVVIPTICTDPAQLARTVRSLLAMDYPAFDVVVVDNRSDSSASPLPIGAPRS